MFTKEDFIMIMAAIEKQHEYDLGYTSILSQVLKTDDVPTYDHSNLSNLLFALLQKQFIPIGGQCEIERYCWELNFGWADGNRVITYEHLWDALIARQSLNTDAYANSLEVVGEEVVAKKIDNHIKHKTFNSVTVGDYHGTHAHYFFKEEHGLEHFNAIMSCDGKNEVEGRVISVIGPKELIIEHKKLTIFEGQVIVITDFSINKDGFTKKEEK